MLTLVSNNPTATQSYERYQQAMAEASRSYDLCILGGMPDNQASLQLSRDMAEAWAEYQSGRVAQPRLQLVKR